MGVAVAKEVEQVIYLSEGWWFDFMPNILGQDANPRFLSDAAIGVRVLSMESSACMTGATG